MLLLIAGMYQMTPMKYACLRTCQSPLGFLMTRWRTGSSGAFVMGLEHGVYCVGCCWAMMLLFLSGSDEPDRHRCADGLCRLRETRAAWRAWHTDQRSAPVGGWTLDGRELIGLFVPFLQNTISRQRSSTSERSLSAAFHNYGDVFGRRGARPARREEGAYREYVTDEQRSAAGCIGGRMSS